MGIGFGERDGDFVLRGDGLKIHVPIAGGEKHADRDRLLGFAGRAGLLAIRRHPQPVLCRRRRAGPGGRRLIVSRPEHIAGRGQQAGADCYTASEVLAGRRVIAAIAGLLPLHRR